MGFAGVGGKKTLAKSGALDILKAIKHGVDGFGTGHDAGGLPETLGSVIDDIQESMNNSDLPEGQDSDSGGPIESGGFHYRDYKDGTTTAHEIIRDIP